jgi:hypothetical protein
MQVFEQMLSSSPNRTGQDRGTLEDCIQACAECGLTCTSCADACLGERELESLRKCIRLNQDCADTCGVTGTILARQFDGDVDFIRALLESCARICAACGAECQKHAEHHEHCRICADSCRRCEEQCRAALRMLPASA